MGMIQIDMPMPECCDKCFALDDYGDYPFCLISHKSQGYTFNTRECRMPECPLKDCEPVKPTKPDDNMEIYCGNCGDTVGCEWLGPSGLNETRMNYCPTCGRKVKWDG